MPSAQSPARRSPAVLIALVVLQAGAVAAMLAAAPYVAFDLDRFFVPKELVLHLTAAIAGTALLARRRDITLDRGDVFLVAFGILSLVSALLASNHWLSTRSVAITTSGLIVFWSARAVAAAGWRRALVGALVVATVVGAITGLAQAYGVRSHYMSLQRAPGGTFGNRNFMAHLAAIGVPLLTWGAVTTRRRITVAAAMIGMAILAAALVLSRSRAAWLAVLAAALLLAIPAWRAARRLDTPTGRRVALLALAAFLGTGVAIALPNTLDWKSGSPYLDSVRGMVNSESGSGHGRIVQYRNSLRMAAEHPLLGVGPGNWPVVYPRMAAPNDPSLNQSDEMTSNPWPSSDWVAMIAERGAAATGLLLTGVLALIVNTWIGTARATADADPVLPVALTAVVVITGVVGSLDAVLLLAAPTLVVWTALGALALPGRPRVTWTAAERAQRRLAVAALAVTLVFALRSAAAVRAMTRFRSGTTLAEAEAAAHWDPGAFRIQWRLAQLERARHGCVGALGPARRASAMFPAAPGPRVLVARCGH